MVDKRTPKKSSSKSSIKKMTTVKRGSSPSKTVVSPTKKMAAKDFIKKYQKEIGLGSGAFATAVASALIAKKYNDTRRNNLFEGEGPRNVMPHTKMYYGARGGAKSAAEKARAARDRVNRMFSRKGPKSSAKSSADERVRASREKLDRMFPSTK